MAHDHPRIPRTDARAAADPGQLLRRQLALLTDAHDARPVSDVIARAQLRADRRRLRFYGTLALASATTRRRRG